MDVLVFLVKEEFGIARPVLNMMREAAEVAQADRANLWHQICATEDENIRLREEMDMEQTKFTNEKAVLAQRLTESEATTGHLRVFLCCDSAADLPFLFVSQLNTLFIL